MTTDDTCDDTERFCCHLPGSEEMTAEPSRVIETSQLQYRQQSLISAYDSGSDGGTVKNKSYEWSNVIVWYNAITGIDQMYCRLLNLVHGKGVLYAQGL